MIKLITLDVVVLKNDVLKDRYIYLSLAYWSCCSGSNWAI